MTKVTTIKITEETKELLDEKQVEGETYNATVKRLAGGTSGNVWTEDEIRSMARAEAKEMIRQYGGQR